MTRPPWEDDENKGPSPDDIYDRARDWELTVEADRQPSYTIRTFRPNHPVVEHQMQGPWYFIDEYITKVEGQGAEVHVLRDGYPVYQSSDS